MNLIFSWNPMAGRQVISPSLLCPTPYIWKAPSYEAAQCQVVLSNKNEDVLIWDQTFGTPNPNGGLVKSRPNTCQKVDCPSGRLGG